MPNPLVNAFTVAALLFTALGVIRPIDLLLIIALSFIVIAAAPVFHSK